MKKYLIVIFILLSLVNQMMAQSESIGTDKKMKRTKKDNKIYNLIEEGAEFPGGMNKLFEFANKNILYPITALNDSIYGRVTVQVIIEKDGGIREIKVVKGIRQDIDEEAIRLIKSMPKWVPGSINGIAVRTRRLIPIKFILPAK